MRFKLYLGRLCAGITVIGFQTSYALPILCRLLFVRGPLEGADSLGALSIPFAVISCVWLFGTSTLFFLPSSFPVAAATMNYACVVVGFFFIVAALYWLAWARRTFAGPKRKHDTLVHESAKRSIEMQPTSDGSNEVVLTSVSLPMVTCVWLWWCGRRWFACVVLCHRRVLAVKLFGFIKVAGLLVSIVACLQPSEKHVISMD